jgi:hypothetical protein
MERWTPAVVQRASTEPAAALASRVAQCNGDAGGAHGIARSGAATFRRRCGAGGALASEAEDRGGLRRACAHFNASPRDRGHVARTIDTADRPRAMPELRASSL